MSARRFGALVIAVGLSAGILASCSRSPSPTDADTTAAPTSSKTWHRVTAVQVDPEDQGEETGHADAKLRGGKVRITYSETLPKGAKEEDVRLEIRLDNTAGDGVYEIRNDHFYIPTDKSAPIAAAEVPAGTYRLQVTVAGAAATATLLEYR